MTHNTWARKYLKTMCKNFMTAFQMGYADGTAGNERQSPPFPEEAKPGTLVYAATLLHRKCITRDSKSERRSENECF